jgi:hypothetical protein
VLFRGYFRGCNVTALETRLPGNRAYVITSAECVLVFGAAYVVNLHFPASVLILCPCVYEAIDSIAREMFSVNIKLCRFILSLDHLAPPGGGSLLARSMICITHSGDSVTISSRPH